MDTTKQAELLAAEIRRVDGDHSLGAAALAEALMPFIATITPPVAAVPEGWRNHVQKAIDRAKVFDDGSDGADAESARSVVAILSDILSAVPQPQANHSTLEQVIRLAQRGDAAAWSCHRGYAAIIEYARNRLNSVTQPQAEATQQPAIPEGFTPWGGGGCPEEAREAEAHVVFRDGSEGVKGWTGEQWCWRHDGTVTDIIAYRVEQPATVNESLTVAQPDHSPGAGNMVVEAKAGADDDTLSLTMHVSLSRDGNSWIAESDEIDYIASGANGEEAKRNFARGLLLTLAEHVKRGCEPKRLLPKPAEGGAVDRDAGGRIVREAWVRWALTQPNPKPSWLVPYDQLSETDKEADRQIFEACANRLVKFNYPGNYMPPDSAELERMADTIGAMRVNGFDSHAAMWVVLRIRGLACRLANPPPTAAQPKPAEGGALKQSELALSAAKAISMVRQGNSRGYRSYLDDAEAAIEAIKERIGGVILTAGSGEAVGVTEWIGVYEDKTGMRHNAYRVKFPGDKALPNGTKLYTHAQPVPVESLGRDAEGVEALVDRVIDALGRAGLQPPDRPRLRIILTAALNPSPEGDSNG